MKRIPLPCAIVITMLLTGVAPCSAATFAELDAQIAEAHRIVKNMRQMPDSGIPRDLLDRANGLAVFPGVVKAGVLLGVQFGSGVVLKRDTKTGQWSKPAFFRIRGGSLGLQVGAQFTDLILLIMTERAMQKLLEDRFTLGADIAVAAGPVGREASAETGLGYLSGILSYSRAKGLFAGVSLKGAVTEPNREANAVYHGPGITVQDVFYEDMGALSDNARMLVGTLDELSK